jgi:hypothetical protein
MSDLPSLLLVITCNMVLIGFLNRIKRAATANFFFHFHCSLPCSAMSFQQFFKKGHERNRLIGRKSKMSQNLIVKPAIVQPIFSLNIQELEILIATYRLYFDNTKTSLFQEINSSKANTLLSFSQSAFTQEVNLENHSSFVLSTAELSSENLFLTT